MGGFKIDTYPCPLISCSFITSAHHSKEYNLLHIWHCACNRDMHAHFPEMTSKFLPVNKNRLKQALGTETSFPWEVKRHK